LALAHPPSLVSSLALGCRLFSLSGDNASLEERAGQLIAVATEQRFPFYAALGTIYRGWAKTGIGDVAEGISLLHSGAGACTATGAKAQLSYHTALLAVACGIAGQCKYALSLLNEGLEAAETIGERWFAAELYRHKGQLTQQQGNSRSADELYRQALTIAKEQEAKLWELRAAVNLGRLLGERGRRSEAHDLVAPVYGWFTDGFGTQHDLKAAKALLQELR
jgi:predicted ATPase